jgi:hypothetical protein
MDLSEKLDEYFESLLNFNWNTFNALSVEAQMQDWRSIFQKFERILREEHQENSLDCDTANAAIFKNIIPLQQLPIERKLSTRISSRHLVRRLYEIVNDFQLEIGKQQTTATCDCTLSYKFHKTPTLDNLTKLKVLHDGYYNPTLYACKICDFQWISYVNDDSIGATVYEKYEV